MCTNNSDILADTLRESAALCPSVGLATDVAPGFQQKSRGLFVYSSQPTPLPLTFSHSDQDGVKPVYDSCCGKMGQFLQPTEACAATRAGLAPLQKPVAAGGGWAGGLSQRQCQLQALAKLWP